MTMIENIIFENAIKRTKKRFDEAIENNHTTDIIYWGARVDALEELFKEIRK